MDINDLEQWLETVPCDRWGRYELSNLEEVLGPILGDFPEAVVTIYLNNTAHTFVQRV